MTHENPDILFEKKDTNNRAVAIFGIWSLVVCVVASVLMIPLTHYLWDLSRPATDQETGVLTTPPVVLEVLPQQDYKKMSDEDTANKTKERIHDAMEAMLKKGFPARS